MQYPPLTSAKAINFASQTSFSPYYDIVWSFDYAISGNPNTEAGFTVFLTKNELAGGSGSIDLGYSGLSSKVLASTYSRPSLGMLGAVIGVGFDTTGLFAASAFIGSYNVRDGIPASTVTKNSVTLRGPSPHYNYSQYNYHQPLSSLNSTFTIVQSAAIYKTVRVRVGNIGRTLYIDYRNNPEEEFRLILQKDISIPVYKGIGYYPGISFATPISSTSPLAIGNIFVKNIHIEGGN
jgi:hypothetical protein